ncbi:CLCA4 [Bugula neritina]|uniref:CLCA4 n=1 Tax=Bugula neritina TaxID=10212 RepID=A0A7J7JPJ4_BUGNE|nr:CLCA4 [Bugula neritina]
MVQLYSGSSISKRRILLLSDGKDLTAKDILPDLPNLNITIDTIIYGQGTDLAVPKIAEESGGMAYFADDDNPEISLQQAMVDTSNQGCSEKAIVSIASRKKTVSSTDTSLNGTISFDSTIGQNTTLVFSYSGTTDIDVNVTSAKGNNITITKDLAAKVVKATVEGQANDDDIEYTITKANPNDVVEIVVSVTSKPIPDVDPIIHLSSSTQIYFKVSHLS